MKDCKASCLVEELTIFIAACKTHKRCSCNQHYKRESEASEVNLPGTEGTVIKQAVPPGGDCGIALGSVKTCDFPKWETRVHNFW